MKNLWVGPTVNQNERITGKNQGREKYKQKKGNLGEKKLGAGVWNPNRPAEHAKKPGGEKGGGNLRGKDMGPSGRGLVRRGKGGGGFPEN